MGDCPARHRCPRTPPGGHPASKCHSTRSRPATDRIWRAPGRSCRPRPFPGAEVRPSGAPQAPAASPADTGGRDQEQRVCPCESRPATKGHVTVVTTRVLVQRSRDDRMGPDGNGDPGVGTTHPPGAARRLVLPPAGGAASTRKAPVCSDRARRSTPPAPRHHAPRALGMATWAHAPTDVTNVIGCSVSARHVARALSRVGAGVSAPRPPARFARLRFRRSFLAPSSPSVGSLPSAGLRALALRCPQHCPEHPKGGRGWPKGTSASA